MEVYRLVPRRFDIHGEARTRLLRELAPTAPGTCSFGLTVRPAQPGPNTVLVHVLPLEGAAAAADVSVSLVINGRPVPLDFCSRSCRTAEMTLAGW